MIIDFERPKLDRSAVYATVGEVEVKIVIEGRSRRELSRVADMTLLLAESTLEQLGQAATDTNTDRCQDSSGSIATALELIRLGKRIARLADRSDGIRAA